MKNNIFSSLETNVSCNYKKNRLPQFEQITYHNHDGYEFYLFLKGNAEYYVEGVAKKLERGDFIIIKPYSFHFCNSNPDTAYERVFINIRESYLTSLNRFGINLEENLKKLKAGDLSLLKFSEKEISSFIRMANEIEVNLKKSVYGSEALVDSLLVQILIMINRKLLAQNQELDYISIMPAVKYNWLNRQHFSMYSKLALGVIIGLESGDNHDKTKAAFGWQASAVGAEFGSAFRGFLEVGFGEQGTILAGLRYKF